MTDTDAKPTADIPAEENKKEKKSYNSLWTQKYNRSEIKDDNYLYNTIEYIRNNRIKHKLPENKELEKIKKEFICSVEDAFRDEYNGGFDVVIGNPPYVTKSFSDEEKVYLNSKYETAQYQLDLYVSFINSSVRFNINS